MKNVRPAVGSRAPNLDEPAADWVPLRLAPFYCSDDGFVSNSSWIEAVTTEIKKILEVMGGEDHPLEQPPTITSDRDGSRRVSVDSIGITTSWYCDGSIVVYPNSEPESWAIGGLNVKALLDRDNWLCIAQHQRKAADWHYRLIGLLFSICHERFQTMFRSGAIHMMARKGCVFSPFERVTWDQWQVFKLDEESPKNSVWHERLPGTPASATAPDGAHLYSIYLAAGVSAEQSALTPEEKCTQWVLGFLREFIDRPPDPLHILSARAVAKFEGLSERGFVRSYRHAQVLSGNYNWSTPGRPRIPTLIRAK